MPTLHFITCYCILTAASIPLNAVITFHLYVPLVMNPGKASLLQEGNIAHWQYVCVWESCFIQQICIRHLISVMHCYRHVGYASEQKKPKALASMSWHSSGFSLENITRKGTVGFYGIPVLNSIFRIPSEIASLN